MYNPFAADFDRTRKAIWPCVANFLDTTLQQKTPLSIIDIGAGNGKYVRYLQSHPSTSNYIVACDISLPLLEIIKDKLSPSTPTTPSHTDLFQSNGLYLPIRSNTFDAAISIAVLHHLPTPNARVAFIKEALRVITPNANLFMTVWALEQKIKSTWIPLNHPGDYNIPWNHTHTRFYHLFSRSEIQTIFEDLLKQNYIKEYHMYFEKDNWCITCTKQ